ncbi:MCE family protein [Nocardioides sp.]|uniref:MCE family protein n=1 Tax=Nocardioides sp. TaxID=35761 RepID=UPI0035151BD2
MKLLDKKTSGDLVRLLIFILVTSMATGVLVILIGNLNFASTRSYKAVFTDATGVFPGDDVRIAGVKVGSVQDIEIVDAEADSAVKQAMITFSVQEGTTLDRASQVAIRYRNLVGQRYLSVTQGIGDTDVLPADATIPVSQTQPALDLTVLFDGFKPLFEALSPDDLNKLSFEVVQVFQGEGGTLESLLSSTASVTSTLADRDAVIGQLLDNLNVVLERIGDRDEELSALIISFKNLVSGLKDDREAILDSFDQITDLSVQTADLVKNIRAPFVRDIAQLRRLARNLDQGKAEIDRALQVLPIKLEKVGRTAIYGSWFNFYLCDFKGTIQLPGRRVDIAPPAGFIGGERCDLARS